MTIDNLVKQLTQYNEAYRNGEPLVSDSEYDILVEQLEEMDPNNPFLDNIGIEITDEGRKRKLPILMASMDKIKSMDELTKWYKSKNISKNEVLVLTPKFDGLSFCVAEETNEATTRGDGAIGQASDEHYKLITNHLYENPNDRFDPMGPVPFICSYGEVMMRKDIFNAKYSHFANPRNLVAGLINNKEATEPLKDLNYIKYGAYLKDKFKDEIKSKHQILDLLNDGQTIKVSYKLATFNDLSEEFFVDLFKKWSIDYELDGIIIEIDSIKLQEDLGRERSGNPCFARAYKSKAFEETGETTIEKISDHISKQGLIKPVGNVTPVKIGGVIISNVTLNNYKFVKENNIGVGSVVRLSRSGGVIPKVVEVIKATGFKMPDIDNIAWNDSGVELICLSETKEQNFKKIVAFFEILEVEQVGEGVLQNLFDYGFNTVKSILNLSIKDLEKLDGFGKRKASIVYENIQSKIKNVELSKLMHSSGCFAGLGSKKLVLLEHFTQKPTVEDIIGIEGFAETSALAFIEGYDNFYNFIKELPVTVKKTEEIQKTSNDLDGKQFVFTGVRSEAAEQRIMEMGGKIGSGVSKNTSYLIMKAKGSGSSKEVKAESLGVGIMTLDELNGMLGL